MDEALVNGKYILKKFPGKGGWTYAEIPEILQNKENPFGWVKVRGSIDSYDLKHYKLMPMGEGRLFLPVKAAIRKVIGKQAGDEVHVILYKDELPIETPQEIRECLSNEPGEIQKVYQDLKDGAKKSYLDWIYEAKSDDTKAQRIATMIEDLYKMLEGKSS